MNPFNIREAGQTKNAADAAKLIGVSIPSTSGKPVRQENMKVQMNKFKSQSLQHQGSRSDSSIRGKSSRPKCLNPFNIREAGQTASRTT